MKCKQKRKGRREIFKETQDWTFRCSRFTKEMLNSETVCRFLWIVTERDLAPSSLRCYWPSIWPHRNGMNGYGSKKRSPVRHCQCHHFEPESSFWDHYPSTKIWISASVLQRKCLNYPGTVIVLVTLIIAAAPNADLWQSKWAMACAAKWGTAKFVCDCIPALKGLFPTWVCIELSIQILIHNRSKTLSQISWKRKKPSLAIFDSSSTCRFQNKM